MTLIKADLLYHIYNWMTTHRADLLDGNIRRTPIIENTAYDDIIENLCEDTMLSFKTEEDVLNSDPRTVGEHFDRVLNEQYGYSIYQIVDRVWNEEFFESYQLWSRLGLINGEIAAVVDFFKEKGITIENIVEKLPTGLIKIEADEEGKIYFTEEQFENLVKQEIYKRIID